MTPERLSNLQNRGTGGAAPFQPGVALPFSARLRNGVSLMNRPVLDSGVMGRCTVSYLDTEGIRHSVEVEADTLYEAVVLAVKTFKQHNCEPSDISKLDVEVRSSVTHTVTLKKVRQWLNGGAKTPKEAVTKERLRALL